MKNAICCTVKIAGPGAGKTHDMVDIITNHIPTLKPNRFLAAITYTNEATNLIRARLQSQLKLPANVFIGTIHSFLIRFIIEPYAYLYDLIPLNKCYIDAAKVTFKTSNHFIKRNVEIKNAEKLASKGFVTFDKILEKSYELVSNQKVCLALSNRLQYVFIDEYQDSRMYQHLIFKKMLNTGKTKLFVIGDPHQSIFNFTYRTSQLKNEPNPTDYENMPINDFKNISYNNDSVCCEIIRCNHRSRPNIVDFVNNFNIEFTQDPIKDDTEIPVIFINDVDKERLVEKFFRIRKKCKIPIEKNIKLKNLLLSRNWKTFENISNKFGIRKVTNEGYSNQLRLSETMRCIYGVLGITRQELNSIPGIDDIVLRKLGFEVLKKIDNNYFKDKDIAKLILLTFQNKFGNDIVKKQKTDIELKSTLSKLRKSNIDIDKCNGHYSTIHSSKGLEATSVLVVAETLKLLKKWLETDKKKLQTTDDEYRLGYVGYSRARELLCIACLEKLPEELIKLLRKFNVKII